MVLSLLTLHLMTHINIDLRFTLGDTFDYSIGVKELVTAGSRAFGSLVSHCCTLDGIDYDTYTKHFNCTVTPITDYAFGVLDSKPVNGLDKLQKLSNSFLSVDEFTSIPAITDGIGVDFTGSSISMSDSKSLVSLGKHDQEENTATNLSIGLPLFGQ
ncbi:unnamed protein product [Mytilus coruscus]|uniref:Uncharacterized protein n=1 Tax=Mytilus coruscus TaxID=42192 RepID=A0A6J8D875_MYTCO|nr:unnamed protein product [Mytilus coruscus]